MTMKVDAKPWSSPPMGHHRKHLSLPANLPSLLRNSDQRTAEYRRRHPSTGVRFADEVVNVAVAAVRQLSYRRETALQGAKSGRMGLGDGILRTS